MKYFISNRIYPLRIGKFKIVLLFAIIINTQYGFTQDFIVGIKYGIGSADYLNISDQKKSESSYVTRPGLTLAFSPFLSKFTIETVLIYEQTRQADYLSIPLGLRISFGKKIKPFIEGGGYYSLLLRDKSEDYLMKSDYGAQVGIGVGYSLNRRLRIEVGYFQRFGFAHTLNKELLQVVNGTVYEKNRMRSFNFDVAFKYRF